jgi:hypothetical protein
VIMSSDSCVASSGSGVAVRMRFVAPPVAEWLRPENDAQWDAFVERHPLGLVYHSSSWKKVLESSFPHIRGQFLALRNPQDKKMVAGLPVYTVNSWLLGRRISSVPFASFCDPLIASENEFNLLLPDLCVLRETTKSRLVEVRSTRTQPQLSECGLSASSSYKHHYLSLHRNLDEIFTGFAKSSIRQKLQLAEKAGVIVEERGDDESLKICHSILAATRSRRSLPVLPYAFFQSMGQHLGRKHLKVFLALQEGKPVAFHLILKFRDMWISEYSGNSDEAMNGVNQLLYWETMKRAHADGAATFSFGRTSTTNEGLLSYKRRWAPTEEDLTEFTYPAEAKSGEGNSKPRESSLSYHFMRGLLSKAPTPLSQMIGNYCYRHLG